MGDISELRGLIVIVSFLGVLVLLSALIPPQLLMGTFEGREVVVPDVFEAIDIYSFADYTNFTLNNSTSVTMESFILGGHRFYLYQEYGWFGMRHKIGQMFWMVWTHTQTCYQRGIVESVSHHYHGSGYNIYVQSIQISDLGTALEEDSTGKVTCLWKCDDTQEQCYLAYNETAYSSYLEAYNNDALWIFFGMNFDDVNTSYNAWDLIGMLLFFQLPDIHWIINALLAIPIWVSVAYLCYVLIIKIIPFIAGG